jgi:hypothetical protein
MAQHSKTTPKHPEELEVVYAVAKAVQTEYVEPTVKRLDRRTRWMLVIMAASLVLLWISFQMLGILMRQINNSTGPLLTGALTAPYQLNTRATPVVNLDQPNLLPENVGPYSLMKDSVGIVIPPLPVRKGQQARSKDQRTIAIGVSAAEASARGATEGCLFSFKADGAPTPCIAHEVRYITSGVYQYTTDDQSVYSLNVVMALFDNDANATAAVKHLLQRSRGDNQVSVGNYVMDVHEVDYFYSRTGKSIFTFTWSHGSWVYAVTGNTFDAVENLVKALPF